MTYKEFYIWLDGFVTNRHWTQYRQIEVDLILQKMKEVNEVEETDLGKMRNNPFQPIPVPVNPFPKTNDPLSPPWEITCETKQQLND
jgi:hypothetical protein